MQTLVCLPVPRSGNDEDRQRSIHPRRLIPFTMSPYLVAYIPRGNPLDLFDRRNFTDKRLSSGAALVLIQFGWSPNSRSALGGESNASLQTAFTLFAGASSPRSLAGADFFPQTT